MLPDTLLISPPITYSPEIHTSLLKPSLLIAALTHELRNPLTNIILAVDMLEDLATTDAERSYLEIITRASQRINILIKNLAEKQQDEEHGNGIHSLHHLLDQVIEMAEDRIGMKNITVIKEYFHEDHNMTQSAVELKIALTNIVINALDAMKEKNGVLKLVTNSINGSYTLSIEDNGCGISADNMEKIFKPFFTTKTGGLGIGLATTSDILKANNVKMEVESQEGKGTKFTLTFSKFFPIKLVNS